MIAHIYNAGKRGWMLELSAGNPVDGWQVIATSYHANKTAAKAAARDAGAQPWNY